MTPTRRSTDATGLTFPLQLVLVIISGVLALAGGYWLANYQLKNEMAAIRADMRVQNEQLAALRHEQEQEDRRLALEDVRLEETRVLIAELKGLLTGNGLKGVSVK